MSKRRNRYRQSPSKNAEGIVYQRLENLFSRGTLCFYREVIENALIACGSRKPLSDRFGNWGFHVDCLNALLETAASINKQGAISSYSVIDMNLNRSRDYLGEECSNLQWECLPKFLTVEEYLRPCLVLRDFFRFQDLTDWQQDLQDIKDYAVAPASFFDAGIEIDLLVRYRYLNKLLDATHLINVRMPPSDQILVFKEDSYSGYRRGDENRCQVQEPCTHRITVYSKWGNDHYQPAA